MIGEVGTDHVTTIDGPIPNGGVWAWRCTECPERGDPDSDLRIIFLKANVHGHLDPALDTERLIQIAVALDKVGAQLAVYDDLIPKWERDFPDKVDLLREARAAALLSASLVERDGTS